MARKIFKFITVAVLIVVGIFIGATVLSSAFKGYRMAQYEKTAVPYIKMVVPQMSKWDVDLYRSYLWEKARRPEYDESFRKTVSRYSKIGALRGMEEPEFLSYDGGSAARGSLKIITYSVKANYEKGDALITIKLLDMDSGFRVFHFNLESPVTNFSRPGAQETGMKREDWLARFRPMEIKGQCTDSPLRRSFKGTYQECVATVNKLFDKCASNVDNVEIPDMLASREEATKYGSIMGECITAYYFGGEHLSLFNKAQTTVKK